jgi:hypothetical protein
MADWARAYYEGVDMTDSIESRDDTLVAIWPGLADARDKWWQTWEDASLDSRGRSNLSYDIEQGWDAAWECIEQFLNENPVQFRRDGKTATK